MNFDQHLKSITKEEFQNAIAKIDFSSKNPQNSVATSLERAKQYEVLDEIIKTIQTIGNSDKPDADAINRLMGMKLILEALILIAEGR